MAEGKDTILLEDLQEDCSKVELADSAEQEYGVAKPVRVIMAAEEDLEEYGFDAFNKQDDLPRNTNEIVQPESLPSPASPAFHIPPDVRSDAGTDDEVEVDTIKEHTAAIKEHVKQEVKNEEDDDEEEDDELDDDVEEDCKAEVEMVILRGRGKYQQESAACLQRGLANMYTHKELIDLDVRVGKKLFHCHKIVLSAVSNFFRSMITSGMKESNNNVITLHGIHSVCFRRILDYIYCGYDIFTDNNVEEILEASVILQMRNLEEKCMECLSSNLSTDNCLDIWRLCDRHACIELAAKAKTLALTNFEKVMIDTDPQFIEKEMLANLLSDRNLKVKDEDVICKAVMNWVAAEPESRMASLDYLFRFICLPDVSGAFLYKHLLHNDVLQENPVIKQQVDDALKCQLVPDEREEVMKKQRFFRNGGKFRRILIVIGGNITDEDILRNVSCWDEVSNCWYSLESVPEHVGEDFATCMMDNEIYLTGGSRNIDFAACFNPSSNAWRVLPRLNHGRESHGMVAIGRDIYVLGGRNFKRRTNKLVAEIELYRPGMKSWQTIGELTDPVESFTLGVWDSRILLYGGENKHGWTTQVTCFDVRTGTCSVICSGPQAERGLKSVQFQEQGQVLLVSAAGHVYLHSDGEEIKWLFRLPSFNRKRFALASDGVVTTIVGGIDDEMRSDRIENISNQNHNLNRVANLGIPMDGMHVHSVVSSSKYLVQRGMSIGEIERPIFDSSDEESYFGASTQIQRRPVDI